MSLLSVFDQWKPPPPKAVTRRGAWGIHYPTLPSCGLRGTIDWISQAVRVGDAPDTYMYWNSEDDYGAYVNLWRHPDVVEAIVEQGLVDPHEVTMRVLMAYHLVQEVRRSDRGPVATLHLLAPYQNSPDPMDTGGGKEYRWAYSERAPVTVGGVKTSFSWEMLALEDPSRAWVDKDGLLLDANLLAFLKSFFMTHAKLHLGRVLNLGQS